MSDFSASSEHNPSPQHVLEVAQRVLTTEAQAIEALVGRLDGSFYQAVHRLLECDGHVVVTGMGKSGHIGHKIAATLASTGTPAFYVHPGEASHGDLGMIRQQDMLLALSNSGETSEIVQLLPVIKRLNICLIAITGEPDSTIAKHADIHLNASVDQEACPLGLAPTASTSAQLAMGDALALTLAQLRGFTTEDFARSHPGGALGRRLLITIDDVMHQGQALPLVLEGASVAEAIVEMTQSRLGMCAIVDDKTHVIGVLTDGDLRRHMNELENINAVPCERIMTADPQTIQASELAATAVELMQSHRIQGLLVTDEQGTLIGALNFQDLLQAGVV
jgi:arabinose-5-phosphate isomerase